MTYEERITRLESKIADLEEKLDGDLGKSIDEAVSKSSCGLTLAGIIISVTISITQVVVAILK